MNGMFEENVLFFIREQTNFHLHMHGLIYTFIALYSETLKR